ncbi:MAG TPA: pirin family protein [Nitrososphaera sp.]|nr:pirin family protein [Nitrososphaera sp.]
MAKNSLADNVNSPSNSDKARSVLKVVKSMRSIEGGGFIVNRAFPTHFISEFDPFLLLDEMGPADYGPGEAKGAPDHPHRGFETVTYMIEGKFQHKDSQGHSGKLNPGDVQWMTAGAGVIHSEMPEDEFTRYGGRMHGFQLWVNLPRRDKMIKPHYQEIPNSKIPVAKSLDGKVTAKVIAGEAMGVNAVIETRTPIMYVHFTLQPKSEIEQRIPVEYNAFAYVVGGQGLFGSDNRNAAAKGQAVIFSNAGGGDTVSLKNESHDSPLEVLLIAGLPLNEPVARYGPFVMNERHEIDQAIEDYRTGRMGQIN